ncbi:hypothetical protein HYT84_01100 [Candidatus Micrarchaeota archaeon]|nr:hypothetical protein [Candidatus Micrarchaeota archaeon]
MHYAVNPKRIPIPTKTELKKRGGVSPSYWNRLILKAKDPEKKDEAIREASQRLDPHSLDALIKVYDYVTAKYNGRHTIVEHVVRDIFKFNPQDRYVLDFIKRLSNALVNPRAPNRANRVNAYWAYTLEVAWTPGVHWHDIPALKVSQLIRTIFEDKNDQIRIVALLILPQTISEQNISDLMELFENPNNSNQLRAAIFSVLSRNVVSSEWLAEVNRSLGLEPFHVPRL